MRKYLLITGFISCLFLNACHKADVNYVSPAGEIENDSTAGNVDIVDFDDASTKWFETVEKGSGSMSVDVNIAISDTDHIPVISSRKKSIDPDDEMKIAESIFDKGTCAEHRESIDYFFYLNYLEHLDIQGALEKYDSRSIKTEDDLDMIDGWYEAGNGYWHTYQGRYNGIPYLLIFATDTDKLITRVLFYPDEKYAIFQFEDERNFSITDEAFEYVGKVDEDKVPEKAIEVAQTFADLFGYKEKVSASDPSYKNIYGKIEPVTAMFKGTDYELNGTSLIMRDNNELILPRYIYLEESNTTTEDIDESNADETYVGWDYGMFLQDMIVNTGKIYVDDDHVAWADLKFCYDESSTLTENTTVMPFEKVKEAFVSAYRENSYFSGDTFVDKISLVYYPLENPDDKTQFSWIPCWVMYVDRNREYEGRIIINAIDCSLVDIEVQ